jgi:hypothetical protein
MQQGRLLASWLSARGDFLFSFFGILLFNWVSGASYGPGLGCSINYFCALVQRDYLQLEASFACLPANYCLEIGGRSTAVFLF